MKNKKKKIGIVTFHRALNFGAMLQAFALQQTLSEKYDSEIVDYRCNAIENAYYPKKDLRSRIKYFLRWIIKYRHAKYSYDKRRNFKDFENKFLIKSQEVYNPSNIKCANSNFDAFVSGSDQVWNPQITNGDLNFFLKFAEKEKKFSYAASFGNMECLYNYRSKQEISLLLNDFNSLLIREKDGIGVLEELNIKTKDNAKLVCDPVYLLNSGEWKNKLNLVAKTDDYILVFFVADQTNALEFAKNLSKRHNLKVYYINLSGRNEDCPDWCINAMTSGPIEFLEILLGARYVVTTSFHGMSLSIIFNKQFFFELNKSIDNKNSRLQIVVNIFDLENREILSSVIPENEEKIDYVPVNLKLKEYSDQSKRMLFESLSNL